MNVDLNYFTKLTSYIKIQFINVNLILSTHYTWSQTDLSKPLSSNNYVVIICEVLFYVYITNKC